MAESPTPSLAFPSVLHNQHQRLSEHLNLQEGSGGTPTYVVKRPLKSLRDQNGGKRWIRRKDNGTKLPRRTRTSHLGHG